MPGQAELERLAAALGEELQARGWRVSTAESCTGGWIAQCLTSVAGSSDWFDLGWVTYSNDAKIAQLGVAPLCLETWGAVSAETAEAMAVGALERSGADLALAVTGIAGPGGGSAEKPVGTVWFGVAVRGRAALSLHEVFSGGRAEVRAQAVEFALRAGLDELG